MTVPEGWIDVPLSALLEAGGIFDGPFGSHLKTSDYTETGVRVLRLENIANLAFIEEKRTFISWAKYETLKKHTVVAGDILFGSFVDGDVRVCLLPSLQTPAVAKADCFCIRPVPDGVDRRFLVYQLGTIATRDALLEEIHGVTRPRVTTKQLRSFRVALPPLVEQRRIADVVDATFARIRETRRRLGSVPLILRRFRQSVIAAGCSGRFTEEWRKTTSFEPLHDTLQRVHFEQSRSGRAATDTAVSGRCILSVGDPGTSHPPSWRWIPLTDVARLESGHTPSRRHPEYWNGHIPWVGLQDAREHHGGRIVETRQHVTDAGLANSSARLLPPATVCLSRTASLGYVVMLGRPMATSQDFVNWVCSEALEPEFLLFALLAEGESITNFGRGTTHTTIYFPEVKALHICLPPLAEQREIIRRIRATLPIAESIDRQLAAASARVDVLAQSILAKAYRGELVPTEAELARAEGRDYEPAQALLVRIKTERAARVVPLEGPRRLSRRAGAPP